MNHPIVLTVLETDETGRWFYRCTDGPRRTAFQELRERTVGRHQHILNSILVEHGLWILAGGSRTVILEHASRSIGVPSAVDKDLRLRRMPDQVSAPDLIMKHPALDSVRLHVGDRALRILDWILESRMAGHADDEQAEQNGERDRIVRPVALRSYGVISLTRLAKTGGSRIAARNRKRI